MDFANDAANYAAKKVIPDAEITFNKNVGYLNTTNGSVFGPFKASFNSRYKITSISANDINGQAISSGISFYTDASGRNSIQAKDINSGTNFYIKNNTNLDVTSITVNVESEEIYTAKLWILYNNQDSSQRLLAAKPGSYTKKASATHNITTTGSLYIHKEDSETGNTLEGAGFKIYKKDEGWLVGTSSPYQFTNKLSEATEYTMDNNNKSDFVKYMKSDLTSREEYLGKWILKIGGLRSGTYHIYETKAPNGGYVLETQTGYDKNNKYVDTGVERMVGDDNPKGGHLWNRLVSISNKLKISISGRVWEEGIPDKGSYKDYDSLYNSNIDHNLGGIIVKLIKKEKDSEKIISTITTNSDGTYLFDKLITKSELKNCYIQFDYSSKITGDKKYIPVAFNKDKINGSKALVNTIPTNDAEVTGIATTYKPKEETDNLIATYGLENVGNYNSTKLTLECINLGIKPLLDPYYELRENIAYLKLKIKGYTYTYYYGGTEANDNFVEYGDNGPIVKWGDPNSKYGYLREIYPSDIIYNNDNNSTKQKLEATVVYRIDVNNTTNENTKELYQKPDTLHITSIENKYDTKRYTLIKDENWTENTSGTAVMTNKMLKEMNKNDAGIGASQSSTGYIQFKVKEDAIAKILENPNGIIEEFPTQVTANAYHKYERDDYMWGNLEKTGTNITGVKSTGNERHTRIRENTKTAPYLVFKIDEQRTISGKVFKDKVVTDNGEKLGNGKYDSDEKGVEGVKVELLDIGGEKLTLSHLYQGKVITEQNKTITEIKDAVVTTNSNGEYRLEGVVPGRYYLRFTYGNGNYKITRLNGEVVGEGKPLSTKIEGKEITAKEYKSTIINENIKSKIRSVLNYIENRTGMTDKQIQEYERKLNEEIYTWYKDDIFKENETYKGYSVAIDDISVRKQINETQENLNAQALSPQISITIENDTKDNSKESKVSKDTNINTKKESGNSLKISVLNNEKENVKNEFGGFYFGVIEQPKQDAEIEKLITNVKLSNSQGNVLYNGNPENISTQGAGAVSVTDLDNKQNGGSTYVRAEVVEESLYGSNLEITYEVRIANISDVNYYNEDYYKYGEKNANKEVTLTPNTVTDYLDKTLKYNAEKSEQERIEEVEPSKMEKITVDGNPTTIEAQEFKLKGWKALYTNKNKEREEEKTKDKVTLVANRVLSKDDEDMEITSRAEIKEINTTPDPSDTEESRIEQIKIAPKEVHTNGMVKATMTLTPPTGEDRQGIIIYAIAGIISLVLLSTGIVIIKKKIEK